MARRSKASDSLIGLIVVVGAVGFGITKFFEVVGFVVPVLIGATVVAYYCWRRYESNIAQRRAAEVRANDLVASMCAAKAREQANLLAKARAADAREARLVDKYGDLQLVRKIVSRQTWIGQTSEQLRDSVGEPDDVDQKVMKTKKKEVWKYGHKGAARYTYRVTLDNDVVVGWDEKA